nr:immunoglobulin heavy chain junction region [Macaca mulatta]
CVRDGFGSGLDFW